MMPVAKSTENKFSTVVILDNTYAPNSASSHFEEQEEEFVCPIHGKKSASAGNRRKRHGLLCNVFGRSPLEDKLKNFGIKTRRTVGRWRIVKGRDDAENSHLINVKDLVVLPNRTIVEIYDLMLRRIAELRLELEAETQKMAFLRDEKRELRNTAKELEETARRMLRPWVNCLPKSEDMTRALMLN